MRLVDRFQGIRKAALEVAYDNNMLDHMAEEEFLAGVEEVIGSDGYVMEDLEKCDAWLLSLSEDDLLTLCAGEVTDAEAVVASAPKGHKIGPDELELGEAVYGMLNEIFDHDYTEW